MRMEGVIVTYRDQSRFPNLSCGFVVCSTKYGYGYIVSQMIYEINWYIMVYIYVCIFIYYIVCSLQCIIYNAM